METRVQERNKYRIKGRKMRGRRKDARKEMKTRKIRVKIYESKRHTRDKLNRTRKGQHRNKETDSEEEEGKKKKED